jgi:threonine dehydratase
MPTHSDSEDPARWVDPDGLLARELIAAAERRIQAVLPATPLVASPGRGAWLKLESLQVTGAYKVRGALNAVAAQRERGDARPLVAASAGNHALGVAWAARHFGLAATVVVPIGAPASKVAGCGRLGAEVLQAPGGFDECLVFARRLARERGARFLHAFDDPEVIAGQATVALELLEARPDVVVVPIGGGGLAGGMASVLHRQGVRVIGAQVVGLDNLDRALRGRPLRPPPPSLADGLRVARPGALTTELCRRGLERIVLVDEEAVASTLGALAVDDRVVAEGAGAVSVAALSQVVGARRIAVVSGGNIDRRTLALSVAA